MPPIRSQAHLHRTWRGPDGTARFAGLSLWFLVLDEHGHPTPLILQVEEMPSPPDPEMQSWLVRVVSSLAEDRANDRAVLVIAPDDLSASA